MKTLKYHDLNIAVICLLTVWYHIQRKLHAPAMGVFTDMIASYTMPQKSRILLGEHPCITSYFHRWHSEIERCSVKAREHSVDSSLSAENGNHAIKSRKDPVMWHHCSPFPLTTLYSIKFIISTPKNTSRISEILKHHRKEPSILMKLIKSDKPECLYRKHKAVVPLIFSDQRKNWSINAFQPQKKYFVSLSFNI